MLKACSRQDTNDYPSHKRKQDQTTAISVLYFTEITWDYIDD